jgi:ABC-type molybdenum transport system ATPase subunit/photorepair protein PhrA
MDEMTLNVRTAAVRVDGLSRRYGSIRALEEVDLVLDRGITGLLGPNGAGKTTLLSILATVSEPDAGRVKVFGLDPRDAAERVEIRRRLGYLPQELGYHRRPEHRRAGRRAAAGGRRRRGRDRNRDAIPASAGRNARCPGIVP